MTGRFKSWLSMASAVWALSGVAHAQDPEVGDDFEQETAADTSSSGSVSASAGTSRPARARSGGSGSSVYIEMQGRFDAFSAAGVESLTSDSGTAGDVAFDLPAIPFIALGVRLLESKLFVGLGLGFGSITARLDIPGVPEAEASRGAFMLAPVATFDVYTAGSAALYPLAVMRLGSVGGGENDPGTDPEAAFWWGLSLGAGLRGDITENVSAFTEFGWGFSHGSWEDVDDELTRFIHGLFGTVGLAVRLGL